MPITVSSSVSPTPACELLQSNTQQQPFCPDAHTQAVLSSPPLSCSLWLGLQLLSLPRYSNQVEVDPPPPGQVAGGRPKHGESI